MKNDKPLTKRETKKAAQMFNVATICLMDCDFETKEQIDVKEEALSQAWALWKKLFPDIEKMPLTFQGCIDIVKGMRK